MKHLSSWLLAGMLLASLGWNWKQLPAPDRAEPMAACSLDDPGLDLAPDQRERLNAICARTCGRSDGYERQAEAVRAELRRALAAEQLDEAAARALVARAAELHRLALESCLEGVLAVREVLRPEQVARMLEACGSCADGPDGSCR